MFEEMPGKSVKESSNKSAREILWPEDFQPVRFIHFGCDFGEKLVRGKPDGAGQKSSELLAQGRFDAMREIDAIAALSTDQGALHFID